MIWPRLDLITRMMSVSIGFAGLGILLVNMPIRALEVSPPVDIPQVEACLVQR